MVGGITLVLSTFIVLVFISFLASKFALLNNLDRNHDMRSCWTALYKQPNSQHHKTSVQFRVLPSFHYYIIFTTSPSWAPSWAEIGRASLLNHSSLRFCVTAPNFHDSSCFKRCVGASYPPTACSSRRQRSRSFIADWWPSTSIHRVSICKRIRYVIPACMSSGSMTLLLLWCYSCNSVQVVC